MDKHSKQQSLEAARVYIESLKMDIQSLERELNNWEKFVLRLSDKKEKPVTPLLRISEILKKTFETVILEILNDENSVLNMSDLLNIHNTVSGKDFDVATFSGQLSPLVNKKECIIKIEFPENAMKERFYYGLPRWFDEKGNLIEKYIKRLPD